MKSWRKHRKKSQSCTTQQLEWNAHILSYVAFLHQKTHIHGNSKSLNPIKELSPEIPILGPIFDPPGFLQTEKRQMKPITTPNAAYLKSLHVIHPFYYPNLLRCPSCGSASKSIVHWEGWTAAGHRGVHGVSRDLLAIGYQLRCDKCKEALRNICGEEDDELESGGGKQSHCIATTSVAFWKKWEFWEIPRMSTCSIVTSVMIQVLEE